MKISGVKVEGVLRQSADVDDVDQRIRDYEQGTSSKYPSSCIVQFQCMFEREVEISSMGTFYLSSKDTWLQFMFQHKLFVFL